MILFWVFVLVAAAFVAGLVRVVCGGIRGQVFPSSTTEDQDTEEVSS